jgi:hypothetical protein
MPLFFPPGGAITGITTATFTSELDSGNSGTAKTINWTSAQSQKSTLTGNCTFTFTSPVGPGTFYLRLIQDATGSRIVTWPATVKWVGAAAPTLSTAAAAVDVVTFYWNGTNYFGQFAKGFA